jgi:hypothetical protein
MLLVGVIICGDTVGMTMLSIALRRNLFHYYTLLTLAQAGLLFLIAGALDLGKSLAFNRMISRASRENWTSDNHKHAQQIAVPYIIAALVLIALSFVLAYPLD